MHTQPPRFQQFRALLNAGWHTQDGAWGNRPSGSAALLQYGLALVLFGLGTSVMLAQGDGAAAWFALTWLACAVATCLPGEVIAAQRRRQGGTFADTGQWARWALDALILGLPLGHLAVGFVLAVHPVVDAPLRLTWAHEVCLGFYLAIYGWRLWQTRQWQFQLDAERLQRQAAEQGQALALAQLKMLQAQIEPHFLFNTLASVQQLVRKDAVQADYVLGELIRYLREATPQVHGLGSTLGREFGLVGAYLNICKVRMGERLQTHLSIDPELVSLPFAPLILQTLVENAIKHGVELQPGAVSVRVMAQPMETHGAPGVQVTVEDDGVGLGVAQTAGTGVGLRNVRDRLAGLYGGQARLEILSIQPHGVRVTLSVPRSAP